MERPIPEAPAAFGTPAKGEGEELQELGEEEESDGGSDEDDDLPIGQLLERALESSDSKSDAE
ncbi:hypothetical protein CHLRE_13g565311v5 [Chlamydomonas reinhardtii]|uniref:Uncharacterized protein n=1 Tax=Chlamydomonas reinhardtii TaxID=3055 RepID=A8HRM5_CHLRE|nr:uncharacterized protein CHLRE_13g565311v5 [Chlamydomonas reinhardtii]PNW73600.1 hypothetical protein CHLRE_13g565311v5 [Chlamydomonas reinhardtii]|eukprot:XP_001693427.1 predicted protein [Chlamydomonas reinhardtii]